MPTAPSLRRLLLPSILLALLAPLSAAPGTTLGGGFATRSAWADRPENPLVQMFAAYEEADKANDVEARVRLLPLICRRVAETTFDPKDDAARREVEGFRKKARALCQRAIVHPRRALILAGLEGYGLLALPGSSQDLRHHARRQDSERRPQEVRVAAIAAWGAIHDTGTHDVLLDHLRLPSTEEEAQERALAAVTALRRYRAVPRGLPRFELLRDIMLLFTALRDASGLNTGFVTSAASSHWYAVLEAPLVVLWNHLTDQGFLGFAQCAAWWRDNRQEVRAGRL
jgi:hypothetical protein